MTKAVGLAEQLLGMYKNKITSFELIPASGGIFEFALDGELIFSKRAEGRFPEFEEINKKLEAKA